MLNDKKHYYFINFDGIIYGATDSGTRRSLRLRAEGNYFETYEEALACWLTKIRPILQKCKKERGLE